MRKYSVLMLVGLVSMVALGVLLSASPATEPSVEAEVEIVPDVFNLIRKEANGSVITAYISNLTGENGSYDVQDINTSTIWLKVLLENREENITQAVRATVAHDTLIVKFDATQVASYIWTNIVYHMGTIPPQADYTLTLVVSGELISDGQQFAGRDIIKIIYP